jgi:fatty-acyl-CoA synthase
MNITNEGLSYWQAKTGSDPLLETTVGDLLDRRASDIPDQEAIVYSCYSEVGGTLDIRWTYEEYRERVDEVARGLMALRLNNGDHIAVWAANLPEWLLLQMASAKTGLVLIPINTTYRAAELEYVLKQGDVSALFFMECVHDQNCLEIVSSLVTPGLYYGAVSSERLPLLRYVCMLGTPSPGKSGQLEAWGPALFREMVANGAYISPQELRERQAAVKPMDPTMLLYTSGTTGFPKGALLSHYGIINSAIGFTSRGMTHEDDHLCAALPFFHIGGSVLTTLGTLYKGTVLHPLITFEPLKALQIISTECCTILEATPTMLMAVIQHPQFAQHDLSSLRMVVSRGTAVPSYLIEQVKEHMGADVTVVFGQMEACAGITYTPPDDTIELKSATVGLPLPYVDVKIVHPMTGQVVPCGECGELCCRGYLVMRGYYTMPEKTAEVIDSQGWLHTGDLATMDERGYIKIIGRLQEMVVRGGQNISPREIEELLVSHPKVADAQVLGVPDAFFGEELLAVIRPKEGICLTEEELREFCKGRISHQKVPRYFQFTDAYPMTADGKVQKYLLRQHALKNLGLEEVAGARMA